MHLLPRLLGAAAMLLLAIRPAAALIAAFMFWATGSTPHY